MTIFNDGINADKYAIDFKKETREVSSKDKAKVKMVLNGGFAAKMTLK